jgi:hypothetical protein
MSMQTHNHIKGSRRVIIRTTLHASTFWNVLEYSTLFYSLRFILNTLNVGVAIPLPKLQAWRGRVSHSLPCLPLLHGRAALAGRACARCAPDAVSDAFIGCFVQNILIRCCLRTLTAVH